MKGKRDFKKETRKIINGNRLVKRLNIIKRKRKNLKMEGELKEDEYLKESIK